MDFARILNTTCVIFVLLVQLSLGIPVRRSTLAGDIEGFTDKVIVDGHVNDITRFLSIPFAEPPTGQNRFAKPVPKARFNGVFRANGEQVGCMQGSKEDTQFYANSVARFTEDCLKLNIYVPSNFSDASNTAALQTMVWIYGGGFTSGTAGWYPVDILSVLTNTIVVTFNYRVGMFGFLQSKDGTFKGNQGLWDQQLALKWVNQNIGFFNGSPSKVTIFGESAGGASVLYQALYPGNKGLFQRVIAQSGSPLAPWALLKEPNAESFFARIGCSTSDPLTCIDSKSYDELQVTPDSRPAPVVDNDFLMESPKDVLFGTNPVSQAARNFYYSLDIMSGVNRFDGAVNLAYLPSILQPANFDVNHPHLTRDQLRNKIFLNPLSEVPDLDTDTTELILDLLELEYINWSNPDSDNTTITAGVEFNSDIYFFSPAIMALQAHLLTGSNSASYFYEFMPKASSGLPSPAWLPAANHADDLQPVFGFPLQTNTTQQFTQEEKLMSRIMMTLWSNFAKTGNPNTPTDVSSWMHTTWPEYNMTSQKYLQLANGMSTESVKSHFFARRMHFWLNVIPSILKTQRQVPTPTTPKPLNIDFSGIIG